jgi:hypothetical protein
MENVMTAQILSKVLGAGLMALSLTSQAAPPANAPAGTTGLCNDGSYYSGPTRKGACKGHKGVKEWYAEPASAAKGAAPAAKSEAPAAKAGAPAVSAAAAPAGSTGLCKDGTYYTGATKQGACKGHKGVKEWYGASAAANTAKAPDTVAPAGAPPVSSTTPAAENTPVPAGTPNAATTPAAAPPARSTEPKVAAAPGAAAGNVWINKSTKVYHCPGDRWYGKTKEGEYMPEGQATAQGFKPDHGKPCK